MENRKHELWGRDPTVISKIGSLNLFGTWNEPEPVGWYPGWHSLVHHYVITFCRGWLRWCSRCGAAAAVALLWSVVVLLLWALLLLKKLLLFWWLCFVVVSVIVAVMVGWLFMVVVFFMCCFVLIYYFVIVHVIVQCLFCCL